jgi:hypothetical protein
MISISSKYPLRAALNPEGPLLQALLPGLAPNLSSRSQAMRRETLALLAAFTQPTGPGQEVASEALTSLLKLERSQSMLSGGRATPVAIDNLRTAFEFKKLPAILVEPVVRSLLGILNIRWNIVADVWKRVSSNQPDVAGMMFFSLLLLLESVGVGILGV